MTQKTVRVEQQAARVHWLGILLRGDGRLWWLLMAKRRRLQFGSAVEGKGENAAPAWPDRPRSRRIHQSRCATPPRHDGYVFHTLNGISDRRCHDSGAG